MQYCGCSEYRTIKRLTVLNCHGDAECSENYLKSDSATLDLFCVMCFIVYCQ